MKIGLFDPYLNITGGGERYIGTIAEYFSDRHEIFLFWDDIDIKKLFRERLNINLAKVKIEENIFKKSFSLFSRINRLSKLDRLFFLSDGSLPMVFSQNSYLHFQFPFNTSFRPNLKERGKIKLFKRVICNSQYTKKNIDRIFDVSSIVVYPPVSLKDIKPQVKEKIILNVGRFTTTMHNKKQDQLLSAFKQLIGKGLTDWKLILAGGMDNDGVELVNKLKSASSGFPVSIIPNIPYAQLLDLYGKAEIYWHGTGLGEDITQNPEKTEHFGISIVEAMAGGCLPIVVGNGGQTEIIEEGIDGFTYQNSDELISKTLIVIKDTEKRKIIQKNAIKKSDKFNKERFCKEMQSIMNI